MEQTNTIQNPIQKRLAAGMSPLAAFLTEATCGEACWEAREDVCRCCCGGKNHGCMRSENGVRPIRNCKIDGVRRELKAVGGDAFETARAINEASGEPFIFASTSTDKMFRFLPAKLKTATDSQVEKWPELAAWRDDEHWTDEHGNRKYLNKPYLLWIKVESLS